MTETVPPLARTEIALAMPAHDESFGAINLGPLPDAPPAGLSRRDLLERLARVGLVASGAGVLAALSGCKTKPIRTTGPRVGEPIPEDPVLRRAGGSRPSAPYPTPAGPGTPSVVRGTVVPRSSWTDAGPEVSLSNRMGRIERITVHHDGMGTQPTGDWADSARRLESIRRAHRGNGWADIGYHYAVDPAGRVWECRSLSLQGAHVKDQNPGNLGIVVLGNFDTARPTDAQVRAVRDFVAQQMRNYRVPVGRVHTHRELAATACPGANMQRIMVQLRGSGGSLTRV
jgi:hypothetical protein